MAHLRVIEHRRTKVSNGYRLHNQTECVDGDNPAVRQFAQRYLFLTGLKFFDGFS